MPGLVLTAGQISVLNNADSAIETAFSSGVVSAGGSSIVNPLVGYANLDPSLKPVAREPFKSMLAVLMTQLNIPGTLPTGISATVTLAKLTAGGSTGSLTFVDGILTAVVAPT